MQIHEVLTAPRSPWQNAYVERLIGSIRRECLDHVIVLSGVGTAARTRGRRRVLHEHEDAPESRQGRAGTTTHHEAVCRRHRRDPPGQRASLSLRPSGCVAAGSKVPVPSSTMPGELHWRARGGFDAVGDAPR
jgi:Integrase core domain